MVKTVTVLVLLAIGSLALAADNVYYRYPGPDGTVVINDRIPPEAVPRGYDVIREDGRVVKTVPPQLTEEERKAHAQEMAIARARADAEQKMREWDESLLLRYSDVSDIDVAKQRALNDIKVRLSILKSNLRVIKEQILTNQAEAAELERQGLEVSDKLSETQELLRRELAATEEQIVARTGQLDSVATDYERDKARFSVLQERVDKRRSLASPRSGKH